MDCKTCIEKMSLYIDESLEEAEVILLEEHIKRCPQCMEELEMLKMMVGALGELEDEPLPEGFHGDLMAKITRKEEKYKFKKIIRYFSGMAAVILVGVLVVNYQAPKEDIQYTQDAIPNVTSVRIKSRAMPREARMMTVQEEAWIVKTTDSNKVEKLIEKFVKEHKLVQTKQPEENSLTVEFETNELKQELLNLLKNNKLVTACTVPNANEDILTVKISFE